MAIEYLARQQGDQQILINELLGRAPDAKITDYLPPRSQVRSQMDDLGELDEAGKATLSQDAGGAQSPRDGLAGEGGKDAEVDAEDLRGNMRSPLQSSVNANRIVNAL